MSIVVTEQEFLDWKQHRVTGAFLKALDQDREYMKEMLVAGTDDDSNIRGRIATLGLLLSMDYNDFMESLRGNR